MTRVRHATKRMTHYVSNRGQTIWSRIVRAVSRGFRSHAAWSARTWAAEASSLSSNETPHSDAM
ncbi:hypothetical protein [Salinibacter sp. 10B]|uniref:hypothetical protein n=1 Tax=Salinibacter sp. 10B TaxID=1923971 RepID=UPI0011B0EDB2|nr:hypothetical protein [Salinibacter sp. 10B]